jgi:hypothetical protein
MNRILRKRVLPAAVVLIAWGVLVDAQIQPPAPGVYPVAIPNTGQQINPFARREPSSCG